MSLKLEDVPDPNGLCCHMSHWDIPISSSIHHSTDYPLTTTLPMASMTTSIYKSHKNNKPVLFNSTILHPIFPNSWRGSHTTIVSKPLVPNAKPNSLRHTDSICLIYM